MVEYNVLETLEKVAIRLIILGKHTMSDSTGSIVNEAAGDVEMGLARTCLESYKHIFEQISQKPDDLTVLFSMTHLILTKAQACLPFHEIDYKSSYKSEVRGYSYMNQILEVSVMAECDNSFKYFYISFRYPDNEFAYHVQEISEEWVPKFSNDTENNDLVAIQCIAVMMDNAFETFCLKYVEQGRFTPKEFSLHGLKPFFVGSTSGKPPKKQKKPIDDPTSTYDLTRLPQHTFPEFYERLCKLQQSLSQKPNEHARFFALMHEIFIFYHGCRFIKQGNNDWPGGVSYNGDVVEMWFPHSIGTPTVNLSVLRLSLLKNGKDEFYCCIRFVEDHSKVIIKKLSKLLVPCFDGERTDYDRIHNIKMWCSAVIKKFVWKAISGSRDLSFISWNTSVGTSSRSDADSRDDPA